MPSCLNCPEPLYTDEARRAKLEGSVFLHVLVGADGLAVRIQMLRGIGMGLDERAIETVRNWKFKPARDASGRTIPAWVTIQTTYHLL